MAFARARKGLERTFAVVGIITVGTVIASVFSLRRLRENAKAKQQELPAAFVIDLNFEAFDLVEKSAPEWTQLTSANPQLELRKIIGMLREAAADNRVKGVFASLGANQAFEGLAQVQELRNSVADFRQQTQRRAATVAYAESFGEDGKQGTMPYYLASAFGQVYMQPSGYLSCSGISATTPFLKRFLERFNIKAYFFTRERYKNVANQFTHDSYSPEHREATEAVLSGFLSQVVAGVAAARSLEEKQVQSAIDAAPLTCDQAVERGLVDAAKYRDEALDMLPQITMEAPSLRVSVTLPRVSAARYIQAMDARMKEKSTTWMPESVMLLLGKKQEEGPQPGDQAKQALRKILKPAVALITATGPISAGKGSSNIIQTDKQIASGPLCEALSKAREDPSVKAVVLRIDSPGGSAVASDTIHREVLKTKESGKPVIVSMGNVAASGGYYVSAPATKIVAQPGTMTGSIGVAFGKFNFGGLLRDYGVDAETVAVGENAAAMLPFTGFTTKQEQTVNDLTDSVYHGFLEKVAAGRSKTKDEVRAIAQGRIWTGQAALERGLVDKLGGLQDAILLAKQEAGLPIEDDSAVDIKEFPKQRPAFVQLLQRLRGSGPDAAFLAGKVQEIPLLQTLLAAYVLSVSGGGGGLSPSLLDMAALQALQASGVFGVLQSGPQLVAPSIATTRLS